MHFEGIGIKKSKRHFKLIFHFCCTPCLLTVLSIVPVMAALAQEFKIVIVTVFRGMIEVRSSADNLDCILFILKAYIAACPVNPGIIYNAAILTLIFCPDANTLPNLGPVIGVPVFIFGFYRHNYVRLK